MRDPESCSPSLWRDLVNGVYHQYPLCCILRFSLSRGPQGVKRGAKWNERTGTFVPCGVFHHRDHLELGERPSDFIEIGGAECVSRYLTKDAHADLCAELGVTIDTDICIAAYIMSDEDDEPR